MIINLSYWRKNAARILDGIKWRGEHTQCSCFDQDILNYLFSKNYLKLPKIFDLFVEDERYSKEPSIIRSAVYHYARNVFRLETSDPFNRLWLDYFIRTSWFDSDSIGRLYAGVQRLHVGLKQSMINISAMMSGKTRAFFTTPENADALKKIFSIRGDEEIVLADNPDALKKLLDAMNASRGKKVFFIMIADFPYQVLLNAGFEPGKDFVNGMEFLSEAQGVPLNSYPMIQAM